MKPKNLKFPFRFAERAPIFSEGVLYVPKHYAEHGAYPKEELNHFISSFDSVCIEYCSGNGVWVAEKAKENPRVLWIAVEKRFDRVQKIWAKKQNMSLDNLLVVCGDAETFTEHYLQKSSINGVFVNFPDPWPKEKHAKNRIFRQPFIQQLSRVVLSGGEVILVTDDEVYSHQMIAEMTAGNHFRSAFPEPYYKTEWPGYGASFFEELWRAQGKSIRYMKFEI